MDLRVLKVQRERRKIKNQVCVPTGDEARDVAENTQNVQQKSREFTNCNAESRVKNRRRLAIGLMVSKPRQLRSSEIGNW